MVFSCSSWDLGIVFHNIFMKLISYSDAGCFSCHSGGNNGVFGCSCWPASWGNFTFFVHIIFNHLYNMLQLQNGKAFGNEPSAIAMSFGNVNEFVYAIFTISIGCISCL